MLRLIIIFIFTSTYCNTFSTVNGSECFIDIKSYKKTPVIVSSDTYEFLYPPYNRTKIIVAHNGKILVACPRAKPTSEATFWEATCVGASLFRTLNTYIQFAEDLCKQLAFHIARHTGSSCGLTGREIEIGFPLDRTRFARLVLICFDSVLQSPLYASYKLTKSIMKRLRSKKKSVMIEGFQIYNDLAGIKQMYSKTNQRSVINRLVGFPENSTRYIKDNKNYTLGRGHLASKGDFMYNYQQAALAYYMNCAPQWDVFNMNNWECIEIDIRHHVIDNKVDLDIYSGIYGVSTLPHVDTGKPIELYLYVNATTGKKALPVPDIYWKVLYNPKTKEGVAFVLHNNLYDENVHKRYICKDVSDQITWFKPLKDPLIYGHGYACPVQSLRNFVKYVPVLDVKHLMR